LKAAKLGFDLLLVAGMAVFALGLWMAWRPLGVMAAGLLMALLGILMSYGRRDLVRRGESE